MKKTLLAIALSATFSATAFAAPGDAVPNSFSNGTPADADQVNANFTEVVNQISTLNDSITNGTDGIGISSIIDNNNGTFTINLTDGTSTIHTKPKGDKGDIGLTGLKGDKGDIGLTGLKGDKGDIGLTGLKGDKGDIGLTGLKGDKGDIGLTGLKGDKGDIGLTGLKGDKGDTGLTGPAGNDAPAATTYSFRTYGHTFNEKVFDVIDSRSKFISEIQTFTRSPGIVSYTRNRIKSNGVDTWKYETITLATSLEPDEIKFTERKGHPVNAGTPDPLTTSWTETLSPGHISRTGAMEQGKVFGSDVSVSYDDYLNPVSSSVSIQTGALIAVNQTVTVPAGTFTDCIKTSITRSGIKAGGSLMRINTYCAGAGLVKQIQTKRFHNDNNSGTGGLLTNQPVLTQTFVKELSSCKDTNDLDVPGCIIQ